MAFSIVDTHLHGIIIIKPDIYGDDRGFFMESFREDYFRELGIPTNFRQENHSKSCKNVLRGLHFQWDEPMGKLLRVISGKIMLAEVDIRHQSPSLGQSIMVELSAENAYMAWVPPGFANGFLCLEDDTQVVYKCTSIYNSKAESGIYWNDPSLSLQWELYLNGNQPIISEKDQKAQLLQDWLQKPESFLF